MAASGTCSSQRTKSAWVVAGCATLKDGWEGILSPASRAAAAQPSLLRTIQGEAGRNVGAVPGAATSLQRWRKVLISQPGSFVACLADRIGPPRQAPLRALSPASPRPANLRIQDPPWDQEEEGGR